MSARRLRNFVIECFAPRYLREGARPAQLLKTLLPTATAPELGQLLLLYTCRANPILADFIREVYWDRYAGGAAAITKDDARAFIRRAVDHGKTIKRWSDSTIVRVANYLLGTCADYGLLGQRDRSGRRIVPFRIEPKVAAFLAHELHSRAVGDNSLITHEDWRLFGLDADDVVAVHAEGALQGIGKDAGEGSDDGTEPDETACHAGDKDARWRRREQAIPQAAGGSTHGKAGDGACWATAPASTGPSDNAPGVSCLNRVAPALASTTLLASSAAAVRDCM